MPMPSFIVLTCFGMQYRQNQVSHPYKGLQKWSEIFRLYHEGAHPGSSARVVRIRPLYIGPIKIPVKLNID